MTSFRQHSIILMAALMLPLLLFALLDHASGQQPVSVLLEQSSTEIDSESADFDFDSAVVSLQPLVTPQVVPATLVAGRTVFFVAAIWSVHKPARAPPYC